jgi:hypothetical protein
MDQNIPPLLNYFPFFIQIDMHQSWRSLMGLAERKTHAADLISATGQNPGKTLMKPLAKMHFVTFRRSACRQRNARRGAEPYEKPKPHENLSLEANR